MDAKGAGICWWQDRFLDEERALVRLSAFDDPVRPVSLRWRVLGGEHPGHGATHPAKVLAGRGSTRRHEGK